MTPNNRQFVLQTTLRLGNTNNTAWSGPLNLALNGEFHDQKEQVYVQIGSNQQLSQTYDRGSETVISQGSRFVRLKTNEEREKKILALKSDQRFHTIFIKIWKLTFLESNA